MPFVLPKFAHHWPSGTPHFQYFGLHRGGVGVFHFTAGSDGNKEEDCTQAKHPESVAVGRRGGGAAGPQEARHIIETDPAPCLLSVSKVLFHPLLDCVVFPPNPISRHTEKKCSESCPDTSTQYSAPLGLITSTQCRANI